MLPTSHPSELSEREGSERQECLMTCSMVALFISSHGHNYKAMPSPCHHSEVTLKSSAKCHHAGSHDSKRGTGYVCSLSSYSFIHFKQKAKDNKEVVRLQGDTLWDGVDAQMVGEMGKHLLLNLTTCLISGTHMVERES